MESNISFMRNVITALHMVLLTSMYLSMYFHLHLIIEKFGIMKMQTLKVFKKQFKISIGLKHLGTRTQTKTKLLTNTLMNIFRNYIPHKTNKFDHKTPEWMNALIISALKKIHTCEKVL